MNFEGKNMKLNINLAFVLGVVFIALKITEVIDWSWLWVLAPFWVPFAVVMGILGVMAMLGLLLFLLMTLGIPWEDDLYTSWMMKRAAKKRKKYENIKEKWKNKDI